MHTNGVPVVKLVINYFRFLCDVEVSLLEACIVLFVWTIIMMLTERDTPQK